jgi:CMP-N-acetylneuraminic acid synthetase
VNDTIDALIPLKGHSARVPGKNLRQFDSRPLFHVIVATLQRTLRVGSIYIDTDDERIATSAATLEDVIVFPRRSDLLGDDVSVNRLIAAFLESHTSEHLFQTHATNPLLRSETIDGAIDRYFSQPSLSSLFAVTRYQARFYRGDMTPINHDRSELLPTQQLAPLYMENSNFYIFSREAFFEHGRRITNGAAMFEVDPMEAIDIDEERDFAIAEAIATGDVPAQ